MKINEKYLSPDAFGAAAKCSGNQSAPSSKALSPSRSNSSLSLYSSASAPSSPLARKVRPGPPRAPPRPPPTRRRPLSVPQSVRRRTRSGDRCPRARGSLPPDGAELRFPAAEESPDAAPPGELGGRRGGFGAAPLRRRAPLISRPRRFQSRPTGPPRSAAARAAEPHRPPSAAPTQDRPPGSRPSRGRREGGR